MERVLFSDIIDNRELNIISKCDIDKVLERQIVTAIKSLFMDDTSIKLINKIYFVLENDRIVPKTTYASVDPLEVLHGDNIVHVNIPGIITLKKNCADFEQRLYASMLHEVSHLVHDIISDIFAKSIRSHITIRKTLQNKFGIVFHIRKSAFMHGDTIIQIMNRIYHEGFARYMEYYHLGKVPLEQKKFLELYKRASDAAKRVNDAFDKMTEASLMLNVDSKELSKLRKGVERIVGLQSYDIGLHMVYSMIYLKREKLTNIVKMETFEFIREYENVMSKTNFRPIVSIKSGRGLIDYMTVLNEWKSVISKLKDVYPSHVQKLIEIEKVQAEMA